MKTLIYFSSILFLVSCAQKKSCSDFHQGSFEYTDPEYSHIKITRTENTQVEVNTKTKIEAHTSVKWISNCKYELTYEEFKNAPQELNSMVGQKIKAEIIEIGKDRFTCEVKTKHSKEEMEFKVIKQAQ